MPAWRPTVCKDCLSTTKPLSARGLCADCGVARQVKSSRQMATGEGPYYEAWRRKMRELGETV